MMGNPDTTTGPTFEAATLTYRKGETMAVMKHIAETKRRTVDNAALDLSVDGNSSSFIKIPLTNRIVPMYIDITNMGDPRAVKESTPTA